MRALWVLVLVCVAAVVSADQCTDACDAQYTDGLAITFCGTDGLTHSTHYSALRHSLCYDYCGVMALYAWCRRRRHDSQVAALH